MRTGKAITRSSSIRGLLGWVLIVTLGRSGAVAAANPVGPGEPGVSGVRSYDTGITVQKVRTLRRRRGGGLIVGAGYAGRILALDEGGRRLWTTPLSGYMIHDLWCADLDGDRNEEILAACADGLLYCLDAQGRLRWRFRPRAGVHQTPMYAVCVVHDPNRTPYVVCGNFAKRIYYLSRGGTLIKELRSESYSQERPWGDARRVGYGHNANHLRPWPQADGSDRLVMNGTDNHMQVRGSIYIFAPLAERPLAIHAIAAQRARVIGDLRVRDVEADGHAELLLGSSGLTDQACIRMDPVTGQCREVPLTRIGPAGYRVTQTATCRQGDEDRLLLLCGTHAVLLDADLDPGSRQTVACRYAFNDLWQDPDRPRLLLASAQSGGSCIHVIDLEDPGWPQAFAALEPPGKIQRIRDHTAEVRTRLASFQRPAWERPPLPVYLTAADETHPVARQIIGHYESPVFLNGFGMDKQEPSWRSQPGTAVENPAYRAGRDRRMRYVLTQDQVLDRATPQYAGFPGIAFWAGHGNDPYYYQPETLRKIVDAGGGKTCVMIWPELEGQGEDFASVLERLFYPLAAHCRGRGGVLYLRNKNIFWQAQVYLPMWRRLLSGEFADVFTSSMEETTDKTQDLSLAGRMGLWAAGSLDSWGMRCSRDNPSFDRARQFSYQRLPNHFLRTLVYSLAYGATYLNTTYVDRDYLSLIWTLVAKGALYVPRREEILSWSPVHLSMTAPDARYLQEGTDTKWTVFFDEKAETANPMVFSHMNGSWPAAPVTPWDVSRYAAGVPDRRQHFIPPYPHGLVLITPPQEGVLADSDAPRGRLADHLHPLYRGLLQEFLTDGRDYLSPDGHHRYRADTYYAVVEAALGAAARHLPLAVSGPVGWVTAQTAPRHLRLTLVDGGYLNPGDRTAVVHLHAAEARRMTDLLSGEVFNVAGRDTVEVPVPCGLFRFLDIEFGRDLVPSAGGRGSR